MKKEYTKVELIVEEIVTTEDYANLSTEEAGDNGYLFPSTWE
jgi:hypothetical protein